MEEKGKPKRRNNKQTNCRYGAECRNIGKGCKFVHPPQTEERQVENSLRYGMDCLHSKCPYFHHPSAGAAAGSSPSSGEGSSPKQCTVVPPPAPTTTANGESATSPPPITPSRKATNKKKCRWGAGCRNKKCAFTHPAPRTSSSSATTTTTAASSEGGGGVEAMTKSPVVVKSPAGRNSLGEVYSINTPPSGFQSTDTTTSSSSHRQKQQIIFPSLSLSPEKKVLQPTTTTSRTANTTGNTTKMYPPGFGGHSPLFAKGMVGSNHSTPLSNGLANNGGGSGGGINKSNMYSSYLSNATASATTPTTTTMMAAEKGGQQQQQRTPLYSKEVLPAFTSLPGNQPAVNGATMNGGAFHAVNPPTMNGGGGGGGFHNSQFLQSGNGGMAQRTTTSATMQMQQRLDGDDPQNLPIDADWLHEVLGIDGLDINEPAVAAAASQQMHHNMHHNNHHHHHVNVKPRGVANGGMGADNMWVKSLETMPRQPPTPAVANVVPPTAKVFHRKVEVSQEPIDPYDDSEDELPGVILISEDEIGQSRRAALELRLESQQSAHQNADFFFSLLEKCRTNQKKVQSALEESMDPTNGGAKDLDEGNVMALLELNELLIGAIGVAESSEVHKSFVRNDAKAPKVTAPKVTAKPVKVSPPEPKSEPPPKVAAANKEKKKSKKSKKFDKWVKEQEQAKESRAKLWEKKISKENDYIGLIQKLIVAEFLRQSKEKAMGLTSDRVLSDSQAADIIDDECRKAYHTIFRELKVRIVVAGSDNKDLNGRNGTIRFWDKEKKKFCVGLDTKKTADSDVLFLEPEVLDVTVSTRSNKSDKSKPASSYDFKVSDLMTYGGVSLGLNFTLKKSHINALGSAENTKIGLEVFCRQRDEEDRQKKLEEEREKAEEEEARKRRAANKAKEAAAWEKKREQMRRDKEEYERMQREWRMNDEDDEEECKCPASDEESFFDEFDDRWEEQMLEEKREENRKMAKVLGVEPNSDERTLKVAYRKLALKFHPDKWRSDSDHGMSRKDAENKFKTIQSAYDHLMSNFDNSDEDYATLSGRSLV
ncbi:DnaJ domain-containing protein, partial [Skeletonema marinoi]